MLCIHTGDQVKAVRTNVENPWREDSPYHSCSGTLRALSWMIRQDASKQYGRGHSLIREMLLIRKRIRCGQRLMPARLTILTTQ